MDDELPHVPTPIRSRTNVVLIAHDGCKDAMAEWARHNREILARCSLFATSTTGQRVSESLGLPVKRLLSGPLGGDSQVGAMIAEQRLDAVIFFWDPLTTQPHDVDVKALLRLSVLYNIPVACNQTSADFLITSPLFFDQAYRTQRFLSQAAV
ncbi:MAG: methylglyoxal synthase [Candidatus Eremiobacteraeota bacterium]|nr:methylglyoxal synthase [Candidatus Eremiobacteraeota bacterium]